jgi:glycosyltransferase involved in cell wall biosynthesis
MLVTQVSIGRFHHFHLARQLERRSLLREIWTGYPRFKLRDEQGIPPEKIRTFPWLQTLYMGLGWIPMLGRSSMVRRELGWWAQETLDRWVEARLKSPTILVALSGCEGHCGRRAKTLGGVWICDRGSSHIRYQEQILREEYALWKVPFEGIDSRFIDKEETEYDMSDIITVPSTFCWRSFSKMGVPEAKLRLVPYGGRLERFKPVGVPDPDTFTVLFVGAASIRKGVLYLLDAFAQVRHPRKRLKLIGAMEPAIVSLVTARLSESVTVLGSVSNVELPWHYSTADVLVLPSIEEGFGMVMGEAMSCGCPVIATCNTGAENLYDDGKEGFIIPIRSVEALTEAIESVAQSSERAKAMRARARARIENLGGWDTYGDRWATLIEELPRCVVGRVGVR